MKKFLLSILIFSTVLISSFGADSFFTNEIAISTGFPIYTDNSTSSRNTLLNTTNSNRIIVGATADVDLNISEPIKIMFAAETFCDFLWQGNYHYNTFDYAFFSGIKIFPDVGGLNFSIAYVLGNRFDSLNTEEKSTSYFTDWGNGFRIAIQYDFLMDTNFKTTPFAGAYFRYVPRGNFNQDYILSVYAGMKF